MKLQMLFVRGWDDLVRYCSKFSPEFIVDCSTNDVIKILKLADGVPPEIELSLFIKSDFHVEAYKRKKRLLTRDIIDGFFNIVKKYSQVDAPIDRLQNTPLDIR